MSMMSMRRRKGMEVGSGGVGRILGGVFAAVWLGAAGTASALPLLSEVYYDAVGSDDGELFVEIAGRPGTSLEGWVVEGVNGANGAAGPTIVLSGAIGETGLFVVADQRSDGTTSILGADWLANFDFQNGPDSIVLRDGERVVDAVGYGVFGVGEFFAGEGTPAPDVAPGESLMRRFADVDTDDNASDWIVGTTPSPGMAELAIVPEPGTALLLGLGLAGLASAGGRRDRLERARVGRGA
ncbi:MAG: PEP-CTERM sorting domain-containing protein [Spirochaetaceae bacterium]|nr:PEP-CTERM sorting domain-containing protein [Myxococcales bacterium]MCB9724503.1 PEP-CTERM sorting domain-containing protein [Spirochaetaceae bacterium]HPG26198.1 PEP-CTERM sorting domain-containing protein [Myxococcota bacterium]